MKKHKHIFLEVRGGNFYCVECKQHFTEKIIRDIGVYGLMTMGVFVGLMVIVLYLGSGQIITPIIIVIVSLILSIPLFTKKIVVPIK